MHTTVVVIVVCGLWVGASGGVTLKSPRSRVNAQPPRSFLDSRTRNDYDERDASSVALVHTVKDKYNSEPVNQRLVQFSFNDALKDTNHRVKATTKHFGREETIENQYKFSRSKVNQGEWTDRAPRGLSESSSKCVPVVEDDTTVVRAAVILPNQSDYPASLASVMPVLRLAGAEVKRRQLLPSLDLQWLPRDDRCDAVHAQISTFEAVKENVHVFFGPTCEYSVAPVARMIKFWHTPLLTTGALTFDFSKDKRDPDSEYHLLLRAGLLSFRDMALFIIELLKWYRWEKVMLVYEKDGCRQISGKHTCKLMMETLVEFFKQKGLHYGSYDLEKNAAYGLPLNLRREIGYQYNSCRPMSCPFPLPVIFRRDGPISVAVMTRV